MTFIKKIIIALFLAAITLAETYAGIINISTPSSTILLDAERGKALKYLYYGKKLTADDMNSVAATSSQTDFYPVYGLGSSCKTALAATMPDGNMTLDLAVDTVVRDGAITSVRLRDKVYPLNVDLRLKTFPDCDIIEIRTEITNNAKKNIVLREFASAHLPIPYGDVYLSSLYGTWANEARLEERPLPHGVVEIYNTDGVRNSQSSHAEIMLSLDGKPAENHGRVIGAALCYSGNYKLRVDTDESDFHHFFAGINEDNSSYILAPGETFITPELALTYSTEGKGGASRSFHNWAKKHKIAHGDRDRKILLNSWEGVYFDINETGMADMMSDIADMGGELFVMDDGWFGSKYPRDNDTTSLGDWVVNTHKLPHGIIGLVESAKQNGIDFGIWIEPEMTNFKSELFEKHPEYVIKADKREIIPGRGGSQVALDLGNPKVQDLVFEVFDTLMTNYPEIDYIKWDANTAVLNRGSQYLDKDRQSHLFINYHRGFKDVMERIRAKYPDVTIQACASGGGRANYGILPWFDEFWVSDDTDALQRIYLQWGTSHFFPALAMGSHISAAPNHQTGRVIPLKFRIDVAMSGRLGMEIQPKDMTDAEKEQCRLAISDYKRIRDVVQHGNLYRLQSPYDNKGVASLMYVSDNRDKAVLFWYKTETFAGQKLPPTVLAGLAPDRSYKITELNRIDVVPLAVEGKLFSGNLLMSNGLTLPPEHNNGKDLHIPYASRILLLEAQ